MSYDPPAAALAAAYEHATQCMPFESCGLIVQGVYYPVANNAEGPDHFVMEMRQVLQLEAQYGEAQAIVHSHVFRPPIASVADLGACELTKKTWLIVSVPNQTFNVIEPSGFRAPLIGRPWAWGTYDCFGLVRDAYQDLANIEIPDFDREWMWWEKGLDLLGSQFQQAGFVAMGPEEPWRNLDAACCQIRCEVPNHCGLWLDGDFFLHQLMGQVSARVPFTGFFRHTTRFHLRHESLVDKEVS